ncbi:MAG: hypothetical protein GEV07_19155 [Streptosporangiales bacterium]|nr:hypothetical protein [Streptosporangiales bacterium]
MTEWLAGRPPLLVTAAVIVFLQGVLVAVLAVVVGVGALVGGSSDLAGAEVMALFGLAVGAGLVVVARGLFLRRRWGRAPALLTQLLCVPVAVALVQAQQYVPGIVLGAAAVVAAFCVISRPVSEALGDAQRAAWD